MKPAFPETFDEMMVKPRFLMVVFIWLTICYSWLKFASQKTRPAPKLLMLPENKIEEKMVCKDGASDFLFDMGIADSCEMYTWDMPVGEVVITQRQIACKKIDGSGYEIVQGYHSID